MRSYLLLSGLAAATAAQNVTTTTTAEPPSQSSMLPELVDAPVFTDQVPVGEAKQEIFYSLAEVLEKTVSDVEETMDESFVNALVNGQLDSNGTNTSDAPSRVRRGHGLVVERAMPACSPEPTISNYYNIDVSSHSAFLADTKIASVANAAPTPAGYFQNFKNAPGANSANAYLGFTMVDTGYDVEYCADWCRNKEGCLSFNIYFERDPVISPGKGCELPPAFANIKCSFWGVPLDTATAVNKGQWRERFRVGISGSNSYTSYTIGGPVDGYLPPLSLGKSAMNAPLRDCAGTWTYLGYRLYQNQPYDPRLCAAACETMTKYNLAHPPSKGVTPLCGAFGTYMVSKKTKEGVTSVTGQICTFYTQGWDAKYAKNTGGAQGSTTFAFQYSYFYTNPDRQPTCPGNKRDLFQIRGQSWKE